MSEPVLAVSITDGVRIHTKTSHNFLNTLSILDSSKDIDQFPMTGLFFLHFYLVMCTLFLIIS